MKVLIFFVYDHGFLRRSLWSNPTWTLRRETIVGIVKKRDAFIYPPSFINTVVYFVTCDIGNFRPLRRESHYKDFLYLFHKLID